MTLRILSRALLQDEFSVLKLRWSLAADPPSLAAENEESGVSLLFEDMGGEVLVSAEGCDVDGVLKPDPEIVLATLTAFSTEPLLATRTFLGSVQVGSWLEIGGLPLVYGGKATGFDQLVSRLPGFRLSRELVRGHAAGG
jgi:hypothetical protein